MGAEIARLTGEVARLRGPVLANLGARAGALLALAVATLLVGRLAGIEAVGNFALLRLLPWLAALVISAGLPYAITYFVAGPRRQDPRLPSTLVATVLATGAVGTVLWALSAPLLHLVFLRTIAPALVAWSALRVATQISNATVRGALQGDGDLPGSNWVYVLEEALFLPAYAALRGMGVEGAAALVAGLLLADVGTSLYGWHRLARCGFFAGPRVPSPALARDVASFGVRGGLSSLLNLLNLRLDVAILGALAGPVPLGSYVVASRFAELLRLLPLAMSFVLQPSFSRADPETAAARARSLLPRAGLVTALLALPLAFGALLIPVIYGAPFRTAVFPSQILLVGLAAEGMAAVASAFLYGVGRPGLNSLATGAGLAVTVILDLLLIPRWGAVGAAMASSAAYLTTTAVILMCFRAVATHPLAAPHPGQAGRGDGVPVGGQSS
jgi:O-antigen/teichoic acid export membrane protein